MVIKNSLECAKNIVNNEIERICREILVNIVVYKETDEGNKGLFEFISTMDLRLV